MLKLFLLMVSAIVLASCQPAGGTSTTDSSQLLNDITRTPSIEVVDEEKISFVVDNVALTIPRPTDWEYYETDYGIVLAEYIRSVATDGRLDGLLTHVFVPPLDDFAIPAGDEINIAWWVLREIIDSPEYVGGAVVSEPIAFKWGGQDAAYYLMDNGEGNVTIVVGVIAPQTASLVASSISAPVEQANRIRAELPALLNRLVINDEVLDGSELDFLPDPLIFPRYESHNPVRGSA